MHALRLRYKLYADCEISCCLRVCRCGCSLMSLKRSLARQVDSTGFPLVSVWDRLRTTFPDVVFIPEQSGPLDFASVTPLQVRARSISRPLALPLTCTRAHTHCETRPRAHHNYIPHTRCRTRTPHRLDSPSPNPIPSSERLERSPNRRQRVHKGDLAICIQLPADAGQREPIQVPCKRLVSCFVLRSTLAIFTGMHSPPGIDSD